MIRNLSENALTHTFIYIWRPSFHDFVVASLEAASALSGYECVSASFAHLDCHQWQIPSGSVRLDGFQVFAFQRGETCWSGHLVLFYRLCGAFVCLPVLVPTVSQRRLHQFVIPSPWFIPQHSSIFGLYIKFLKYHGLDLLWHTGNSRNFI